MKVAVSAVGDSLDAQVDRRFGRCAFFIIVDSESMQFNVVPNAAVSATGGAGIQAAQTLTNYGVQVVITGNVGPNAFRTLSGAGIEVFTGASGSVREVVESYKKGGFKKTGAPTVGGHFGMGMGQGQGQGRGQGRGRQG